MADETKGVKVPVETSFDGAGTDQAAAAFRKTTAEAQATNKAFGDLGDVAGKLTTQLAELATFAVIVDQFREGWNEAKALAGEFRMLEMAAVRVGEPVGEVRKQVKDLAEELRKSSAITETESIPAIVRLYREYGNMGDATKAVRLAQALAASDFKGDFSQALEAVHMAAVGNTRALKQMGIVIEDAKGAAQKGDEALKALAERARTATVDHSTLAFQMKALNAELESLRIKAAESIKEVLPTIVSVAKTSFIALETGYKDLVAFIQGGIQVVVDAWGIVKKLAQGDGGDQLKASFKQLLQNIGDVGKTVRDNHTQAATAVTAAWTKSAHDIAQVGKDLEVPAAFATAKEKAKINVDFLESDWQGYLRDLARREKAQNTYFKNVAKMRQESTEDILRHFGIEETAEELMQKKTRELAKQKHRERMELDKQEMKMQVDIANAAVGIATDLFGSSKETAIASAVINTYEGATKALAQGGVYGAVLAAIVIAAGLAQVAKIESTQPATGGNISGGFDDPSNDQMAYVTGRRWARDALGKLSGGWQDGLASSHVASSTTNNINNSRSTTMNVSMMDPTSVENAKKLLRTLKLVDRDQIGQTSIATRTK